MTTDDIDLTDLDRFAGMRHTPVMLRRRRAK
jgi:hypothetical protein